MIPLTYYTIFNFRGIIGNFDKAQILNISAFIFTLSISFHNICNYCTTPLKTTQGTLTEEDIRSKKKGNFFLGNFHNMNYRDFEWGFYNVK
jgi:hypothetical protein